MEPLFFTSPAELREWFEKNHDKETELIVGYYKVGTKIPSINWSDSVDVALCFGWIDGIRRSIDEKSYNIRFTPRRRNSNWSSINIAKVEKLKKQGLMTPAGLAVYSNAQKLHSKRYSYENKDAELPKKYLDFLRKNSAAWDFFNSQPPSYQKIVYRWIMSAKQEETKLKRLKELIADSEAGLKIKPLRRK